STPDSIALRQQILNEAKALATRINGLNTTIEAQLNGLRGQREAIVVELNGLTENIALLNKRITHVEASEGDAKALRDQRDQLIKDMAGLIDVRVQETADGSYTLSLANGQPLVSGPTAAKIKLDALTQEFSLEFPGVEFKLGKDAGWGGQLGGLYDVEQNSFLSVRDTLSQIAEHIATLFNDVLTDAAFDVNGNAGQELFTFDGNSISELLTVNNLKPEELAFSSDAAAPGNNDRLLDLLKLKNQAVGVTIGGVNANVTLNDAYATLLGGVASASRQSQADTETAKLVRDQA